MKIKCCTLLIFTSILFATIVNATNNTSMQGPAKVLSIGLAEQNSQFTQGRAVMLIRFDTNDLAVGNTNSNSNYSSSNCSPGDQFIIYKDSLIFSDAYTLFLAAKKDNSKLTFEVKDTCEYGRGREIVSVFYAQENSTISCDDGYNFSDGACRTPIGCPAPQFELSTGSGQAPIPGEPPVEPTLSCADTCNPPAYGITGPARCTAYVP